MSSPKIVQTDSFNLYANLLQIINILLMSKEKALIKFHIQSY